MGSNSIRKSSTLSQNDIQMWIIRNISEITNIDENEINPTEPFISYGFDSMHAVTFVGDMEEWLGLRIQATLLWDYPTIHAVSSHLFERICAESK